MLLVITLLLIKNLVFDKEKKDITEYKVEFNDLTASIYYEKEITEEDILNKEKQIASLEASIKKREALLSNTGFVNKAPLNLVEGEKSKLESEKKLLESLK